MRDGLTDRLTALESRVSQATRLVPAADVRRRGDRRTARRGWTAVMATVVVLTGGAGVALAGGGGVGRLLDPGPPAGPVTALPAQVRLPHENRVGWSVRVDTDAPAAFQPCTPGSGSPVAPEITLVGRIAARSASGPIAADETTTLAEQVLIYSSANAAADAMRALRESAQACGWDGPATYTDVAEPASGDRSVAVSGYTAMAVRRASVKSGQGALGQPGSVFELALVRRVDNVVVIAYRRSLVEFTDNSVPDASIAALTSITCSVLRQCELEMPPLTPTPWLWSPPRPTGYPYSSGAGPR